MSNVETLLGRNHQRLYLFILLVLAAFLNLWVAFLPYISLIDNSGFIESLIDLASMVASQTENDPELGIITFWLPLFVSLPAILAASLTPFACIPISLIRKLILLSVIFLALGLVLFAFLRSDIHVMVITIIPLLIGFRVARQ